MRSNGRAAACAALVAGLLAASAPATVAQSSGPVPTVRSALRAAPDLDRYSAGGLVETAGAPGPAASVVNGFGSVGNCTFYATSSLAGGYCLAGGTGGAVPSLWKWLNGEKFEYCRYVDVPEGMALEVDEKPGGTWMLRICIQDVDFSEPWGGTNTHLEVFSRWVPDGTDTSLSPRMERFWRVHDDRNYYPLPRLLVGPTQKAYVGTYTYFWAQWVENWNRNARITEPEYRIPYETSDGTVYLHARISDLTLHPGRPDMESKDCGDATTPFRYDIDDYVPADEGGSQPSRCWFTYTHSSADEESGTVKVRGTAHWQVQVEYPDGSLALDLGQHFYRIDQRVAVAEVQSIVDSDPSDW